MKRLKRWLPIACLALLLGCFTASPVRAASGEETRQWEAACKAFQDAKSSLWFAQAENRFAAFVKAYPASEHLSQALVFEAQAKYEQGKYAETIDFLDHQSAQADGLADQFAYWSAKAYARESNYVAAADTFARLIRENPNSSLRLEAIFREAEAHAKLEYWPRVMEELGEPNGLFQQVVKTNANDGLVTSGLLLLAEAQLKQRDFTAAEKTWSAISTNSLQPEMAWNRQALLCRIQLDSNRPDAALRTSTNLMVAANAAPLELKTDLRARTIILRGEILERLDELPAAIQTYQTNLSADLPRERQREALLRIVELTIRQNKLFEAEQKLNDFLAKNPDEKNTDFESLMLGELQLKEYHSLDAVAMATVEGTNLLQSAETNLLKISRNFTNSLFLGKADLDLGWCYLDEGRVSDAQLAFGNAAARLPLSEDQAVARFKLADIAYQLKDFPKATSDYNVVLDKYASLPEVRNELFEPALYEIVRASLLETNLPAATAAMDKILTLFPEGVLGDKSMLLVGQAESPTAARAVFADFLKRSPNSPLLPEVKLAIARTYENEGDWTNALAQYNAWVSTYTNSPALPRAEFSRAWANYQSGDETNAYSLFTNYVTRFQTNAVALSNDLPARAQYWVADFFWRQDNFQKAELNYREIFNNHNWPDSKLAYQARMMAGRAVLNRGPQFAETYFTNVYYNSNSPIALVGQAAFALGDVNMALPLTNNPTKFKDALDYFRSVTVTFTNTAIAAQAWGRIGDAYMQLAVTDPAQYDTASNAYARVMEATNVADVVTRSLAEFQMGRALQAMAMRVGADQQKILNQLALNHFNNVIYGNNLLDGEHADPFSVKQAGLQAAKLAEDLRQWSQAKQIYQRLIATLPPMQAILEKKIASDDEQLAQEKK